MTVVVSCDSGVWASPAIGFVVALVFEGADA